MRKYIGVLAILSLLSACTNRETVETEQLTFEVNEAVATKLVGPFDEMEGEMEHALIELAKVKEDQINLSVFVDDSEQQIETFEVKLDVPVQDTTRLQMTDYIISAVKAKQAVDMTPQQVIYIDGNGQLIKN